MDVPQQPLRLPVVARAEAAPAGDFILAPWIEDLPAQSRELLALLPVSDINGTTLAGLAGRGAAGGIVALMLADPFLRVRDTAHLLTAHGVRRVANFPTVQLIDGDTARALDSSGLGMRREVEMLTAFREAGFATVAFACSLAAARGMLAAGASRIVLHPGVALTDWRQRAAAAAATARTLTALRRESTIPLLVYRPAGYGAELDQAIAASDGEARMEDPGDRAPGRVPVLER